MPPRKKTPAKKAEKCECKCDIFCRLWCGIKEIARAFLTLLEAIFKFIAKIVKLVLKFSVGILVALAFVLLATGIFLFLVAAGFGLGSDAELQFTMNEGEVVEFTISKDAVVEEIEVVE